MASVKFTMETKGFDNIAKKMSRASPRAEVAVATQILRDTEQYVPARTMSMANRTHPAEEEEPLYLRARKETQKELSAGRGIVVYPGPYAHYLYVGKLFIDPKTGSAWAPTGASKVITGKNLNISQAVHGRAQSHWFEASKAQNLNKWKRVAAKAVRNEFRR